MRLRIITLLVLLLPILPARPVRAHPLAPGLLEVRENADRSLRVIFKIPRKREPGVELAPRLPEDCTVGSEASDQLEGTARIRVFEARCDAGPLAGRSLGVSGLEDSQTGVLVRVELADGTSQGRMLTAADPTYVITPGPGRWAVVRSHLRLGVEHLLTGQDHGLFLIALTLLIGWGRRLIWTLTLFTVGHSATLALTVLGWVSFPVALVEALIAFSIVVAASELASGRRGWLVVHPYLTAGGFGLLHGMGFAGALAAIGLPKAEIPLALLGFNLGIEVGQLLVVAAVAGLGLLLSQLPVRLPRGLASLAGYGLGSVAALWFWQRLGVFGPG